jgi:DEAD/DEAH box helicase domain-containing protein
VELSDLVTAWAESPDFEGELVHLEHLPAREAIYGDVDPPLPAILASRLAERGVERLFRHQVQAIDRIRSGANVALVAGTAAGKSLCFQVPIVESALANPANTALLIYPTKALTQDQAASLRRFRIPEVDAAVYDGDTPPEERARIRRRANVVLTNPDMLHVGILPGHQRWAAFLGHLQLVVVDEMHSLRGIFGTHVAMILRRLRRLAAHYGSSPTFVFSSATIGNAAHLAQGLCGLPVDVKDGDDSPRGEKHVALWNPPLLEEAEGRRRSALAEATDIFLDLVRNQFHTIVFTRSRKATELIYRWAGERLDIELAKRVAPYRAGYTPAQRRLVEDRLFSGELLGVVGTNALELGIDVGALDAAVVTTFPGTISAFRQQAGRAGRSQKSSLVTLVGGEDALDQYFMTHPSELFTRKPEAVVINPDNPVVAEAHAACAAHELPLALDDREVLGEAMEEAANRLVQQNHLRLKEGRLYWSRRQRPASQIDIRSSGGPTYHIINDGELLGTLDEARAFRDAHQGAIYLHQGDTYRVERLDYPTRQVWVTRADVDYYTQTRQEKLLEVLELEAAGHMGQAGHHLGWVRVESQVVAYQKRRLGTRELLDTIYLDLPSTVFETQAVWLALPDALLAAAGIAAIDLLGALHAAEHAGIALLPLMAVCDRWDIGGLSTNWHPATGMSTIFIYEAYPGGAGISPVAYQAGQDHWKATLEAVDNCPCQSGCPSCVQSPKCGNFNEPLSKAGAVRLLDHLLA